MTAPPDPRHEGLRERIKEWLDGTRGDGKGGRRELPGDLLRDCLVALSKPAAPQPTADELVLAVGAALGATPLGSAYMVGSINWQEAAVAAERAIRAAFAAKEK